MKICKKQPSAATSNTGFTRPSFTHFNELSLGYSNNANKKYIVCDVALLVIIKYNFGTFGFIMHGHLLCPG